MSLAIFIEFAEVNLTHASPGDAASALLTIAWQLSNVPSTSMAVMFLPRVVSWFSCRVLTIPDG